MSNQVIQIITMSHAQLVDWLLGFRGAKPATILSETEVEMRKTGNPYAGRVTKICRAHVFINFIYSNSVNNQIRKEGGEPEFVAHQRKWGQRIIREDGTVTPIVEHTNKQGLHSTYLECRYLKSEPFVQYRLDGISDIDKAEFEEFIPIRSSSAARQGVSEENEVIMRDINTLNIRGIVTDGWDVRVRG